MSFKQKVKSFVNKNTRFIILVILVVMFFVLIGNREQNINFYGKENANSGVFKNNNNEVPVVKYKDENTEHINITLPKQEGEK